MFSMAMRPTGRSFPPTDTLEQPAGVEDPRDIFALCCATLADLDLMRFHVEGFGQAPWPVDVRTDLAVVLEQLPDLFEKLGSSAQPGRGDAVLDFYEQGLERELRFNERNGRVEIICNSRTRWIPQPSVESAAPDELKAMLVALWKDYRNALRRLYPMLVEHPILEPWSRGINLGAPEQFE